MVERQKNGRTAEERQNNDHSERVATVYINSSTSPCQVLNFSLNPYFCLPTRWELRNAFSFQSVNCVREFHPKLNLGALELPEAIATRVTRWICIL
jgi:hypothetical protein